MWNGDDWVWSELVKNEQGQHSIVLKLRPSIYWFGYHVDGLNCHNPYVSWDTSTGEKLNFISVKVPEPDNQPELCEGCPIKYRHFKKGGSIYVTGSWDDWKQRLQMTESGLDHVKLLWLAPGQYYMKFLVDGVECVDQGSDYVRDSSGLVCANTVSVMAEPQFHELHGHSGAAFLNDFMAKPGHDVSIVVNFNAGSQCGDIHPDDKACPCTEIGYMLLNGFIRCFKQEYIRGYSWAGCFKPTDMIIVDDKHCQMRKSPTKLLTRANLLLDVHQLEKCLLLKYKKNNLEPPYFSSLFAFLEEPPEDFDSNWVSKKRFLDIFDNQAALATPPRRMLSLVNAGQFYKQLPEQYKSKFALKFNPILRETSTWQTTTLMDKLLRSNGNLVNPVPNTSLEATYSLRVLFIHGPEHTLDNEDQILTDFSEIDLVIAYYFKRLLADFLECVYDNMHEHVLIKAMWDFYCGGAPPDHLHLAPAPPA